MRKTIFSCGALFLALCFAGCKQPVMNLIKTDPLVYSIELSSGSDPVTEYSRVVFTGDPDTYPSLEITLTNTGNQPLTGLQLKKQGTNTENFEIGILASSALAPGEGTKFTVDFVPRTAGPKGVYSVKILAGGSDASKVITLQYTAYELQNLKPGTSITLNPSLFQIGGTSFEVTTSDTDQTDSLWRSSNPGVAHYDENGKLIVTAPGKTVIYFVTGTPGDYTAKGKKVTVYPAKKTLDPVYPKAEGKDFVEGVSGGAPVLPVNLAAISAAAGQDGDINFEISGGENVISAIDADTGALTFSGTEGNEAKDVKISLGIKKTVPEGILITHSGLVTFAARIVPPNPGPVIKSIELDGNSPLSLIITWDKKLDAASGYAGFSLTGADGVSFTKAALNGAVLTLTMNRAPSKTEAQGSLTLSYNPSNSSPVKDPDGNAAASFTGKTVTVTNADLFLDSPALVSAVIDAAAPTSLTLTFDHAVQAANSSGFSISGSKTATTIGNTVSGSGTTTLTLSLNRKPAHSETLLLAYDSAAGNVARSGNATIVLASITGKPVSLLNFTAAADSRPNMVSVVVDADRDGNKTPTTDEAKTIYLTYDKEVKALNANGFTVSGSTTALGITGISGSGTKILALTLDNWPSKSEAGRFTLSYNMDLGNICDDANNANLALSFSQPVTFENYTTLGENIDTAPPLLVSATVENGTPGIVRVVFNEPVTVDSAKFYVKVNDIPYTSMAVASPVNGILLDVQKRADRAITSATAVNGANGASTTWDITMSVPAVHGEILRLATSAAGAAQDLAKNVSGNSAPNLLPQIPQFIISNKVKRVRGAFESMPGLYINGVKESSVTDGSGGKLYENAGKFLTKNYTFAANDVITIVLDTDQILKTWFAWNNGNLAPGYLPNPTTAGTTVDSFKVIVTTTGNTDITIENQTSAAMFQSRNGMILVIDEHVIFKGSSSYPTKGSLIQMLDGGSIIMDGGEIRDHLSAKEGGTGNEQNDLHAGAIRIGGGSRGGYFIMNGGKITNNTAKFATTGPGSNANCSAGGVIVCQYGVIVMTGGEISNNVLDVNGATPTSALAGGIMANTNTPQRHANASFFMTGGEIFGNKVINSTASVGSAGGVLVSGTFQKNGGTIYGSDTGDATRHNTTTLTGSNKASAVFVSNVPGVNPPPAGKRENSAGPEVTLFVESFKLNKDQAATNTVPAWATSLWD